MQEIAYLTSCYPAVSHTFIQREILAVRAAGVTVHTLSIRRPAADDPRSQVDRAELEATYYVLPPRWGRLLAAHARTIITRPLRYVAALGFALAKRPPGLRALLWQLFYFVEAVCVWHELRRRGVRHVHVHFAMACASVAMIANRLGDLTYSMTVHGPAVFYEACHYRLRDKVKRAAMVACISDFCRSQVMSFADPADWHKLQVVHCGVDPTDYTPRPEAPPAEPGRLHLLNVARLSPVKGHDVLLQAIADLRDRDCDVTCTIIGDGPERARLERRSRDLGVDSRVQFTGVVDQDRIQTHYDQADVFVLPSFAEGVPVVLMEAMAKGLPVITTRVMGIPELVDDGVSGLLVPPGRSDRLVEAIRTLAHDVETRKRMGREGRDRVCREYDVRQSGTQLVDLFARMAVSADPAGSTGSARMAVGATNS